MLFNTVQMAIFILKTPCPLHICHVFSYYKHSTKHETAAMQNFRRLLHAQFLLFLTTYKFKSFHLLEVDQYQLLYNLISYTYHHISPSKAAVYLNFKIVWSRILICWRHIRCCFQDRGWLKQGKQMTAWITMKRKCPHMDPSEYLDIKASLYQCLDIKR